MLASFLPHSSSSGRQFFSFMPGWRWKWGWEGEEWVLAFKLFFFIRRVSLPVLSLEDPYSIPILANIEKSPSYGTNCYFKETVDPRTCSESWDCNPPHRWKLTYVVPPCRGSQYLWIRTCGFSHPAVPLCLLLEKIPAVGPCSSNLCCSRDNCIFQSNVRYKYYTSIKIGEKLWSLWCYSLDPWNQKDGFWAFKFGPWIHISSM